MRFCIHIKPYDNFEFLMRLLCRNYQNTKFALILVVAKLFIIDLVSACKPHFKLYDTEVYICANEL